MQLRRIIRLAPLLIVLAGCGGGAGTAGGPVVAGGTETAFDTGELQGRAAISNPPITSSSAYCVSTALTGTFSSLKLKELNPSLGETRIYYTAGTNSATQISSCAIDGSDVQRIATASADWAPTVSQNGKIAFVSNRTSSDRIWLMNADGSNQAQLTSAGSVNTFPSIDAAGDKVAFMLDFINAAIVDVASKKVTPLTLPGQGSVATVALAPDGNTVYFDFFDGTDFTLYKESSAPGSQPWSMGHTLHPDCMAISQDGSEVAIGTNDSPPTIERFGTADGTGAPVTLPQGSMFGLSYSPDKTQFALGFSTAAGAFAVQTMPVAGGPMHVVSDATTNAGAPGWGPFTKEHILISSAGGMLGTRACGVIYGQSANRTTSVVAFDATTPSSVVMTAQTPTNSIAPNLVFSVDADTITKLAYTNSYAWRGIRIVGSGTSVTTANGALVSLNAFDGTVVSILPFNGSRAIGSRPKVRDEGTTRIFSGDFLGVFDKDGKNLAPHGATTVKLDTRTNRLSVVG